MDVHKDSFVAGLALLETLARAEQLTVQSIREAASMVFAGITPDQLAFDLLWLVHRSDTYLPRVIPCPVGIEELQKWWPIISTKLRALLQILDPATRINDLTLHTMLFLLYVVLEPTLTRATSTSAEAKRNKFRDYIWNEFLMGLNGFSMAVQFPAYVLHYSPSDDTDTTVRLSMRPAHSQRWKTLVWIDSKTIFSDTVFLDDLSATPPSKAVAPGSSVADLSPFLMVSISLSIFSHLRQNGRRVYF